MARPSKNQIRESKAQLAFERRNVKLELAHRLAPFMACQGRLLMTLERGEQPRSYRGEDIAHASGGKWTGARCAQRPTSRVLLCTGAVSRRRASLGV